MYLPDPGRINGQITRGIITDVGEKYVGCTYYGIVLRFAECGKGYLCSADFFNSQPRLYKTEEEIRKYLRSSEKTNEIREHIVKMLQEDEITRDDLLLIEGILMQIKTK